MNNINKNDVAVWSRMISNQYKDLMNILTKKLLSKPVPAKKGEINYALVDRFTFVHFMIGCFYGILGLSFLLTITLSIVWELLENPLKANFPALFPHATADTLQNSIGDCTAVILGWSTIYYLAIRL